MSKFRVRVEGEPQQYVSLSRARWLVAARRARFLSSGNLQILYGTAHSEPGSAHAQESGPPIRWTEYSGSPVPKKISGPWRFGYRMNGGAVNRGI